MSRKYSSLRLNLRAVQSQKNIHMIINLIINFYYTGTGESAMKTKSIAKGALILTLAGILTRILGFVYRVYMSNTIGAEGMGLYQLIVPIYMLVWSISSSGISTTISKLTAQENAMNKYGNINKLLFHSVIISASAASILSVALYFSAESVSVFFLKDTRAILSLKLICFCFPFMATGSCIRGWFFGLRETLTPAVSQFFEQCVRMAAIFFLSGILIPKGVEFAAAAAVIGMCLGEIASFVYVYLSYKHFKKNQRLFSPPSINLKTAYIMILSMAIPLTANRMIGSLLSAVENILIPQKLQLYGLSQKNAMEIYGELSGMVMPLIMFPSSILTALSTTLLPAISEAAASKNIKRINITLKKAMSFTSIIGMGACGLFITYPGELCNLIYNRFELGNLLFLLGISCPFMYLQVTFSGILNGLGEQVFIFKTSLFSSAVNIFFIYFLIPAYGIYAFIFGCFLGYASISLICIRKIIKKTRLIPEISQWLIKPSFCIFCSCILSKAVYAKYLLRFNKFLSVTFAVSLMGALYILFLLITGCFKISTVKDVIKSAIK